MCSTGGIFLQMENFSNVMNLNKEILITILIKNEWNKSFLAMRKVKQTPNTIQSIATVYPTLRATLYSFRSVQCEEI